MSGAMKTFVCLLKPSSDRPITRARRHLIEQNELQYIFKFSHLESGFPVKVVHVLIEPGKNDKDVVLSQPLQQVQRSAGKAANEL